MKSTARFSALRELVLILLLFVLAPAGHAALDFVQLTDPHLFERADRVGQDLTNRATFAECIDKVNQLKSNGYAFRFVAVTGDIGIELLNPSDAAAWSDALTLVSDQIRKSIVTNWLFVPGNNDLDKEKPKTIGKYHQFIAELKTRVASVIDVVDLCPADAKNASKSISTNVSFGKYAFVGFNNASFKGDNYGTNIPIFFDAQMDCVAQVSKTIQSLTNEFVYVFYHIPEIDDPKSVADSHDPTEDKKLRDKKLMPTGSEVYSAWTVSNDVRVAWDKVVNEPKVKGLITGHFHSPKPEHYRGFDWLTNTYKAVKLGKLIVCPPIACKIQDKEPLQSRGFRIYSIADNGNVSSDIIWATFQKDSGTTKAMEKASKPTMLKICIVVFAGLALGLLVFGVFDWMFNLKPSAAAVILPIFLFFTLILVLRCWL